MYAATVSRSKRMKTAIAPVPARTSAVVQRRFALTSIELEVGTLSPLWPKNVWYDPAEFDQRLGGVEQTARRMIASVTLSRARITNPLPT